MANPQSENGSVKIAYDLYAALLRADITSSEHRVVLAIVALTYGCGKVRAKMSIVDIRALLGSAKTNRLDRIIEAFASLQTLNMITVSERDDSLMVGPQKDYDRWVDRTVLDGFVEARGQNVRVLRTVINNNIYINTPLRSNPDKMSPVDALYVYAYSEHPFQPSSLVQRNMERSKAEELWGKALAKTRDADAAYSLIIDFIDDQRLEFNYRAKVRYQFKYLVPRARQYFEAIPEKKQDTIRDEKALGYRHKYDLKTKRWRKSDDRI